MSEYVPLTDAVLDAIIKHPNSAYSNEVRDMAKELKELRAKQVRVTWDFQ